MTVFHVIAIVLYSIGVVVLSKLFGLQVYVVAIVSAVCIIVVYCSVSVYRARKSYPRCQNPACTARRYRAIGLAKEMGIADSGIVFECTKCSEKYLQIANRFMKLDKHNRQVKYMKRTSSAYRWKIDE